MPGKGEGTCVSLRLCRLCLPLLYHGYRVQRSCGRRLLPAHSTMSWCTLRAECADTDTTNEEDSTYGWAALRRGGRGRWHPWPGDGDGAAEPASRPEAG